jgi:hypothetical protein
MDTKFALFRMEKKKRQLIFSGQLSDKPGTWMA